MRADVIDPTTNAPLHGSAFVESVAFHSLPSLKLDALERVSGGA